MKKTHTKQIRRPRLRIALAVIFILLAALLAAALIYTRFGGFSTGESADPAEMAAYAGSVEDIVIPQDVTVIALGEATHGNAEFHQLKLDVFQHLVEHYGVRAFVLEDNIGNCEDINRYIHGGGGTAEDAASLFGFNLYHTAEMARLLAYMRNYNGHAAEGDDLRFYGIDMQNPEPIARCLVAECRALGVDVAALEELLSLSEFDTLACKNLLTPLYGVLRGRENADQALYYISELLHSCELVNFNQASQDLELNSLYYSNIRDRYMAANVQRIAALEQARGFSRIFISAHNGHVAKQDMTGVGYIRMGQLLNERLGGHYYVIGTGFYKTTCSLTYLSDLKPTTQVFYSHDPLAKAAKRAGLALCWLDFSRLPEGSNLAGWVDRAVPMGSLGWGYSPAARLFPETFYRFSAQPNVLYDGVIYVAEATPTVILP